MSWKFLIASAIAIAAPAPAEEKAAPPIVPNAAPAANPDDVKSADAIVSALYDVISGDAGVKRDWQRFRSLFFPGAHMIPTGKNPETGQVRARMITPDDYAAGGARLEKEGFRESEVARRTESFGNITHVFSTYQARREGEAQPFMRGINSFQLFNDGTRWWILNVAWSAETPDTPLPPKYLAKGQ